MKVFNNTRRIRKKKLKSSIENYDFILKIILLVILSINFVTINSAQALSNFDLNNNAHNYITKKWNVESGFPSNRIYSIMRDKRGFIWLGTDNALVRFDGKNHRIFDSESNKELSNEIFSNLTFTSDGSLWFKNGRRKLIKKNGEKFKIIEYNNSKIEYVNCLTSDSTDVIWIGTITSGLYYLAGKKFNRISENFEAKSISSITVDKENNIWVGTKNYGIYKIRNYEVVERISLPLFNFNRVLSIFVDSRNRIWTATKHGVFLITFNKEKNKFTSNKIIDVKAISFFEDKTNKIWIITKKHGILKLKKNRIVNFIGEKDYSNEILTGYLNDNNGIWITTFNRGLIHYQSARLVTIGQNSGLVDSYVNSIYEDSDNSIFIGTYSGIYKWMPFKNNKIAAKLKFAQNSHIFTIGRDSKSNLVIGTKDNGLFIYKKNSIINYTVSNGLNSNFVRCVYFDSDSSIWVGTNAGGISIFKGNNVKKITKENGLSNNLISFIHKAKNNKYWIGTSGGGVNIIDENQNIRVLNDKNGLSGNIVSSIYEEPNGVIWLTINGGGVTRISGSDIQNITAEDGLFTNKLLNISPDVEGKFWFGTPHGIFSVKKTDILKHIKNKNFTIDYTLYGKNDGMLSIRCVGASMQTALISSNNLIYISTTNGIVEVNPITVNKPKTDIKVYIDQVFVNYKKISLSDFITIEPGAERIEFKFGAINFSDQDELEFVCKIRGLDDVWQSVGNQRNISYSNLPYGNYEFLVKAINKGNKIESNIAGVEYYLKPYFYQTNYFKVLSALLLLGIIVWITRYFYLRKYKQELRLIELENVVEKERMRISKDMHDDIGSVLTKINLLSEIAKRDIENKDKLTNELTQINEAGREVVDTLDEIVWALNPKNDNIENLVSYIITFAEDYLSLADIELKTSVPEEIPDVEIRAEFRHNLFMVIKETLNNIVKYSNTKCVNIPIKITDNLLVIEIRNRGKRIDFDQINKFSNGIKNMKSRIDEIGGEYKIENYDKGVRTKIVVNF